MLKFFVSIKENYMKRIFSFLYTRNSEKNVWKEIKENEHFLQTNSPHKEERLVMRN